jgi:iodotyrosine deiodinase
VADVPTVPLDHDEVDDATMRARARDLASLMARRRSVRHFSSAPVPREVVEDCVRVAASAPSGANLQPWTWVLVGDPEVRRSIRAAAEAEERAFYDHRAPDAWRDALSHLGTDASKPHLTDAPWLLVLFRHRHEVGPDRERIRNYYSKESAGIAAGFLLAALHQVGLVALTHTPSPMGFLREVLGRPAHEEPELLVPVGRPAPGCRVPAIHRRPFDEVLVRVG